MNEEERYNPIRELTDEEKQKSQELIQPTIQKELMILRRKVQSELLTEFIKYLDKHAIIETIDVEEDIETAIESFLDERSKEGK